MAKLTWHNPGEKQYERGVSQVALFPFDPAVGTYGKGVAWNGATNISESPSGAEPTDLWADNIKYATFRSVEEFGLTLEAYMYPDEWYPCDGMAVPYPGMSIAQQSRRRFALVYRTEIGNDLTEDAGFKLHVAYGLTASPSEKAYPTINDSPEAVTFSWECTSTPVNVGILGQATTTGLVTLDSTKLSPAAMTAIQDALYGSASGDAALLLPDEIGALVAANPPVPAPPPPGP